MDMHEAPYASQTHRLPAPIAICNTPYMHMHMYMSCGLGQEGS